MVKYRLSQLYLRSFKFINRHISMENMEKSCMPLADQEDK